MSDLTFSDRHKLERQLDMLGGYVLRFSDRTFADFVGESTGLDIDEEKYRANGSSKAKRLRLFWELEPNQVVGKLLNDLLRHAEEIGLADPPAQFSACQAIAHRLLANAPVESIDAVEADIPDRTLEVLVAAVRTAIQRNRPEEGLDRLHTYTSKMIRTYAARRGVDVHRDKPLHSVFGEYVKALRRDSLVESDMADRILRMSISTLDGFSGVRNERSLAHDNETLGYDESVFIFNHVCALIRYLRSIERRAGAKNGRDMEASDNQTPF